MRKKKFFNFKKKELFNHLFEQIKRVFQDNLWRDHDVDCGKIVVKLKFFHVWKVGLEQRFEIALTTVALIVLC